MLANYEPTPEVIDAIIGAGIQASKAIQVIRFHVWQDLTPSDNGEAPLYATLTIEIPEASYLNLDKPNGMIKIEALDGERLAEARLLINQAHYGLGFSRRGVRQVQFAISPTPMYSRLNNVETVRGTARMRIGERLVTIQLPETKVIFTR